MTVSKINTNTFKNLVIKLCEEKQRCCGINIRCNTYKSGLEGIGHSIEVHETIKKNLEDGEILREFWKLNLQNIFPV